MKFSELSEFVDTYVRDLEDNGNTAQINERGHNLLAEYNKFIDSLNEWISKDAIMNLISVVSAEEKGTQKFKDANRLSTLTNNGKTPIDLSTTTFHNNDTLNNYIDNPNNV